MVQKYDFVNKWAVIDREEMKFIAIAPNHEIAVLIADIASVDTTVVTFQLDVKRHFSHFGVLELMLLHKNTSGIPSVPGSIMNYGQAIQKCYDLAMALPTDPRSIFDLTKEVAALPDPEVPKTMPKLPPILQRLPAGQDYPTTTNVVMPKEPRSSTPRAPGAAPSKGATGKVWGIADRVHAENGGGPITKELRGKIIAACEAEGINGGTAATQYGKWKATKS